MGGAPRSILALRVLYLADIRFPLERANGIQTAETCHALALRGHQVTLVVRADTARPRRDPYRFYDLERTRDLTIRQIAVMGPPSVRRAQYLAAAMAVVLTRPRADVVMTRDLGLADMLLRLPAPLRTPLVYESHGFGPSVAAARPAMLTGGRPLSTRKSQRLLGRERRVWARAAGYATITAGLLRELQERFGSRSHTAVIADGARIPTTRAFLAPRETSAPVIAYAGHLYPWKGVDILLGALERLPTVRGLIVGGHPSEPDLDRSRRASKALGLADRVTFMGLVPPADVPRLLASGDVLVLPNTATPVSIGSTSPLKLFEYLAAGKPIVASDLPSLREVLRHEENAILVLPGDAAALAAGIERVLDDRVLAERIARRAFDEAPEYSWGRRAERLERLLVSGATR